MSRARQVFRRTLGYDQTPTGDEAPSVARPVEVPEGGIDGRLRPCPMVANTVRCAAVIAKTAAEW